MVPAPALGFRSVLVPGAKRAELTADWMIAMRARNPAGRARDDTGAGRAELLLQFEFIWGILTSSNR